MEMGTHTGTRRNHSANFASFSNNLYIVTDMSTPRTLQEVNYSYERKPLQGDMYAQTEVGSYEYVPRRSFRERAMGRLGLMAASMSGAGEIAAEYTAEKAGKLSRGLGRLAMRAVNALRTDFQDAREWTVDHYERVTHYLGRYAVQGRHAYVEPQGPANYVSRHRMEEKSEGIATIADLRSIISSTFEDEPTEVFAAVA